MSRDNKKHIEFPIMRDWLNPAESWDNGYYKLSCNYEQYEHTVFEDGKKTDKTGISKNLDISLDLADCSRLVAFAFDCSNKKQAKERLEKVHKIQKVIGKIEHYLERYLKDDF